MLKRIISGGQTGVDRAALDVALELGIPCGGWCPKGRRAEDGPIPEHYPLQETNAREYPARTEKNVREADGTLILSRGQPDRGTALTARLASRHQKPCLCLDLGDHPAPQRVLSWIEDNAVETLNVAGPRETSSPGIYGEAVAFLREVLFHAGEVW
jgi:hypothetical protein